MHTDSRIPISPAPDPFRLGYHAYLDGQGPNSAPPTYRERIRWMQGWVKAKQEAQQ